LPATHSENLGADIAINYYLHRDLAGASGDSDPPVAGARQQDQDMQAGISNPEAADASLSRTEHIVGSFQRNQTITQVLLQQGLPAELFTR